MAKATVKFIIDNDGNYHTDTNGIKGSKCLSLDKLFGALGEVQATKNSEFFQFEQPDEVNIVKGDGN